MSTRLATWRALRDTLAGGRRAFVVWVADHTRHSPGTRGAMLVVPEGGGPAVGTVGGGAMEQALLATAREALKTGTFEAEARELSHRRDVPEAQRSGMICAGRQTNVAALLEPDRDTRAATEAARRLAADEPGVVAFEPGLGLSVADSEGSLDPAARPVRLTEGCAGWRYEEQLLELRRAAIFGAGHCGLALSQQLAWLGYVVTVADVRGGLDTLRANAYARHRVVVPDYAEAAAEVLAPEVTPAVVMTADFPSDVRALEGALRQPFPFIGVMGAPAKLQRIHATLRERGFGDADLARLTAPIGVPIGSSTPTEIAVSVAAQLIAERREFLPGLAPSPMKG